MKAEHAQPEHAMSSRGGDEWLCPEHNARREIVSWAEARRELFPGGLYAVFELKSHLWREMLRPLLEEVSGQGMSLQQPTPEPAPPTHPAPSWALLLALRRLLPP